MVDGDPDKGDEFQLQLRDAIKLRYDWEITNIPAICTCGDLFTVDHAMVCRRGGGGGGG